MLLKAVQNQAVLGLISYVVALENFLVPRYTHDYFVSCFVILIIPSTENRI